MSDPGFAFHSRNDSERHVDFVLIFFFQSLGEDGELVEFGGVFLRETCPDYGGVLIDFADFDSGGEKGSLIGCKQADKREKDESSHELFSFGEGPGFWCGEREKVVHSGLELAVFASFAIFGIVSDLDIRFELRVLKIVAIGADR